MSKIASCLDPTLSSDPAPWMGSKKEYSKKNKTKQVYPVRTCQEPDSVMLANGPLVKGNHSSNLRVNMGGATKVWILRGVVH